jgi:hypothetical protein
MQQRGIPDVVENGQNAWWPLGLYQLAHNLVVEEGDGCPGNAFVLVFFSF